MSKLNVCFVSAEVTPFAKSGGLGDVAEAIGRYVHREGHDIRVFLPLYASVDMRGEELHPVDFLQHVTVPLGTHVYTFSVYTAPLPDSELFVYFVHCPALYDRTGIYTNDPDEHRRFLLLSRAAIESCQRMGFAPHVLHCNDWQTALSPLYLQTAYAWDRLFAATRTVLTIHNIGYQGVFPGSTYEDIGLGEHAYRLHQDDLAEGRVNYLKNGILSAGLLTTVSPTYAQEIQTEAQGVGLDGLLRERGVLGILNGVDYGIWCPETDDRIPFNFSADDLAGKRKNRDALLEVLDLSPAGEAPVIGIISRLVEQKGFELCFEVLPLFLSRYDMRLVILGSGEHRYEAFFTRLQQNFPGRVCFYRGFSAELAALIEAGSDMFLMPSRYEPCGLNQMYSLKYGTVPIVRRTGGLADTVQLWDPDDGTGTGFVFDHYTPEGLAWALRAAFEVFGDETAWMTVVRNGMAQDFSWDRQIKKYTKLYADLAGSSAGGG